MVLYFIGLGLGDERDITVRGLEAVKQCDHLYLEHYTSLLCVGQERLEAYYGKPIKLADREFVESQCEEMLDAAENGHVGFLVVGDPFGATTHTDLYIRAVERSLTVEVIHNASILNAVGCCGLQLYRYGQSVSLCMHTDTWKPDSWYPKMKQNVEAGLHTLCLLDIKVKEPNMESLMRGRVRYEPPRFMRIHEAARQLLAVERRRGEGVLAPETKAVGLARVGQRDQLIRFGTLEELAERDFGEPLHSMVVCAPETHFLEDEMLKLWAVRDDDPRAPAEEEEEEGNDNDGDEQEE